MGASGDCHKPFRVRSGMGESAADFERRDEWMRDWSGPRGDWATRGAMDVAFRLEALGPRLQASCAGWSGSTRCASTTS